MCTDRSSNFVSLSQVVLKLSLTDIRVIRSEKVFLSFLLHSKALGLINRLICDGSIDDDNKKGIL